jgi:hypothetical protein
MHGDLTLVEDLVRRRESANDGVTVMATVPAAGPETPYNKSTKAQGARHKSHAERHDRGG